MATLDDQASAATVPAEPARGYVYAVGAYLIWGLVLPVFMKTLEAVGPLEIVAHRVLWALPFAVLILALGGGGLRAVGRHLTLRNLMLAALCALVISVNWSVYVYAIVSGQGVAAALGYYINPLLSLLLGVAFLGERPSRRQWFAIVLAAAGVLVLALATGGLPWISLVLPLTFGLYGLLRKIMPYGAAEGFFLEVAILFLPALGVALTVASQGQAVFGADTLDTALLIAAGPITAIPLVLFAAGARLLRLSTVGMLQYLTPTLLGLTAVFLFGEPFGLGQLVAFGFIWAGLALYTSVLLEQRRARTRAAR